VAIPAPAPDLWTRLVRCLSSAAWVIIAGLLGGFIAGVSSRLMMRLSGVLTIEANRFLRTDTDATVGKLTFGGTLFLGGLGAAAGVLAVCFYIAIRHRLPFTGRKRSAVFAGILLAVFGYVLMNPANPDYHRFGPAWVNVFAFSSLYLIMGFVCAEIYEARPLTYPCLSAPNRLSVQTVLSTLVFLAITISGSFIALFAIFLGWQSLIIPILALLAWAATRIGWTRSFSTFSLPVVVRQWGIWVVPGLVGFILTARGVTEILLHR